MSTERKHHATSASSLAARETCPRYQGRTGDNEASIAGTMCHAAVETGDFTGLTDEQAEAVQKVIDHRDAILKRFRQADPKAEVYAEIEVEVDDRPQPTGETCTSGGFLDWCVVSSNHKSAILMDWKFVQWEVEPVETNLQFWTYVLGLKKRFPKLEVVEVHCVCPYLGFVDEHTFTSADFERMYLRVLTTVERTKVGENEGNPSFPQCTFCANIGRCEAVAKFACHISHKFSPLQVPEPVDPNLFRSITPEGAKKAMQMASVMSAWSEGVRQVINDMALSEGLEVEGFVLVRQVERKIVDPLKFEEIAKKFIPSSKWPECYKVYLTKVEKAIAANSPRGEKQANIDLFDHETREAGAVEDGTEKAYLRQKKEAATD